MITRQQILKLMPAANGQTVQNYSTVVNGNIIKTIHSNIDRAAAITKPIAYLFAADTVEGTARNIWNFLRYQIKYVKDDANQNIKLPNRFLSDGTGDCKSYSLFAASIFNNLGIKNALRYASYDKVNPTPQHVYSVAITDNSKCPVIITDGVWYKFNEQKKFTFKKDYMPINTLTGTDEIGKFGDGLKKAVAKVQDKAKGTAVVKQAAKIQDKAKGTAVIKKMAKVQDNAKGTAVVKQLAKQQSNLKVIARKGADILKQVPNAAKVVVNAPARRAFRTLVAVNFHNFANTLAAKGDETYILWKKLGGQREELEQSIRAGQSRKALLGIGCTQCQIRQNNEIGSVTLATVASFLAVATPVIIAFFGLLKYIVPKKLPAADTVKVDESGNVVTEGGGTATGNTYKDFGYGTEGGAEGGRTYTDPNNNTRPEDAKSVDAPAEGGGGGLVLAAIAAKLLFF